MKYPFPSHITPNAVFAALSHVIWVADPDGFIRWVNEWSLGYFGKTFQESLGFSHLTLLHPDDQATATSAWEEAAKTGEPLMVDYRLRTANGEYRWQSVKAQAEKDATGQIKYWIGTCTDIHEQLARVEKLRAQLAKRNSESTER